MTQHDQPLCSPSAAAISYIFVRHIGFILDELSCQGLVVWQDESHAWQWKWRDISLQSKHGFWAPGEALVDAVVSRYPLSFVPPLSNDEVEQVDSA